MVTKKAAARPQDLLDVQKIEQHSRWKSTQKKSKKKRHKKK
jgi:hypothetical protein